MANHQRLCHMRAHGRNILVAGQNFLAFLLVKLLLKLCSSEPLAVVAGQPCCPPPCSGTPYII
eukprot:2764916-Pyramimonas_sp.AAC.1